MMTRKHYKAIAEILKKDTCYNEELVNNLGKFFKEDNPRFKLERFKKACGFLPLEDIIGNPPEIINTY